jgi:hypothetical protein
MRLAHRPGLHAAAVLLSFTALYAAFFAPVLCAGRLLAPGDATNLSLPHLSAPRGLWSPLLFCGFPVMADPQTMAWYPPALLCAAFALPFNAFVLAAYVLASCFTYGYVFALTGSRLGALGAGLVYGLSGFMTSHLGHTNVIHSAAWAPLLVWSLERLRLRPSRAWVAVAAVAVGAGTLAGHPQFAFYNLLLGAGYALAVARGAPAGPRRFLGAAAGAMALGLGLAAVLLVPLAELTVQSYRARLSFDDFAGYSLPLRQLPMLLFPYLYGGGSPPWGPAVPYFGRGGGLTEATGYVGLLPWLLAGLGFSRAGRRGLAAFWLAAALLSLLLALGKESPLVRLAFHLPVYNKFRIPARHFCHLALAVAVLAGLGLDAFARLDVAARLAALRRGALAVAGVSLALLLLFVALGRAGAYDKTFDPAAAPVLGVLPWRNAAVAVPLLLLGAGLAALGLRARRPGPLSGAVVAAALCLDVGYFGWCYSSGRAGGVAADVAELPAGLRAYRDDLGRSGQRLVPLAGNGPAETAPPNRSRSWGVPSALGYCPLVLQRYCELTGCHYVGFDSFEALGPANRAFDVLAVRYALAPRGLLAGDALPAGAVRGLTEGGRWERCQDLGEAVVFRNRRAMPRAWLTPEVTALSADQVRRTIQEGYLPDGRPYDPWRTALVEAPVPFPPGGGGEARVTRLDDTRVEVEARCDAPAFLVLSDVYYPGWVAEVNGRAAALYRTDYVLRGVALPAGVSRVVFEFRPWSFRGGAAVTCAALLVVLGLLARAPLGRLIHGRVGAVAASGRRMRKSVPRPGVLSTSMAPPWSRTMP